MQQGPSQLLKLPFQTKTHQIHLHQTLPYLLRISPSTLQNYNLKQEQLSRSLPLTEPPQQISHLLYSNKKLIYSTRNQLRVNDIKEKIHGADIRYLLADGSGIVVTAAEDRFDRVVKIVSVAEDKGVRVVGEFSFHYDPVSALYWKNSLAISGDTAGEVCLWDINKCQTVFHRKIHYEPVRHIGTYLDYSSNNIFYTVSPQQKRLIFSDLRTNSPIRILTNLHSSCILSVSSTPTGKILIAYEDIIDVVDIHREYQMVGHFSPMVVEKMTEMRWTAKSFSFGGLRKIGCMLVQGKYAVVGCDNGCIEVYDTDTLECLYGFGIAKFGPLKSIQCNLTRDYIAALDSQGDVYLAKFSPTDPD